MFAASRAVGVLVLGTRAPRARARRARSHAGVRLAGGPRSRTGGVVGRPHGRARARAPRLADLARGALATRPGRAASRDRRRNRPRDRRDALLHSPRRDRLTDGNRRRVGCARRGAARGATRLPAVNLAMRSAGRSRSATCSRRPSSPTPPSATSRPRRAGVRAVLATPLLAGEQTLGVLCVQRAVSVGWSSADVALAEAVAREAAAAVETARLLRESEQRLAEQSALLKAGQQQARSERGFYRIASVLSEPLSAEATLEAVAQAASESLQGDGGCGAQARRGTLELAASHSLPDDLATYLRTGGAQALAPSARAGRVLTSRVLADDSRFADGLAAAADAAGFRSLLAVPLPQPRGDEAGLALVFFAGERTFTDEQLELAGMSPVPPGARSSGASSTSSSGGRARSRSGSPPRAVTSRASSIRRTCSIRSCSTRSSCSVPTEPRCGCSRRTSSSSARRTVRAPRGRGGTRAVDDVARRRHRPVPLDPRHRRRAGRHARGRGRPDARPTHAAYLGVPMVARTSRPRRARRVSRQASRVARGRVGGAPALAGSAAPRARTQSSTRA